MSETDPLGRIRQELKHHDGKPLDLTLAADEVEALREALDQAQHYPQLYAAWNRAYGRLERIRDVRVAFHGDRRRTGHRSPKREKRADEAVQSLGWTDTGDSKQARLHYLLFDYRTLTTEGGDEFPVGLFANEDIHPHYAPTSRFLDVPNAPLGKQDAIDKLADWYGASPETIRKWLKEAKAWAKRELKSADDRRARYLKGLLAATLPGDPGSGSPSRGSRRLR